MKVLIDGRLLGYFGPGEYIKNIILNLARLDRENNYYIIINKDPAFLLRQDNFHFFKIPYLVRPYFPLEQILIPYLIKRLRPDFAYFPNFNVPLIKLCPYVVTIHDLIYLLYPKDSPSYLSFCYARFMLRKAVHLADIVITDSEYSRRDIIHYLKVLEKKVSVIPAGVGNGFKPMDKTPARAKIERKYNIKRDFILYVGNHHYHKNISALIDAYSRLKEKSFYNLVIAGKRSWRTKELEQKVKKRKLQGDIIFTDFIPEGDLPWFYNAATCFVFPSLYEGFGLPPLEAMACGVPVIASNKGSLPEILGEAPIYIDPLKTEELKEAMEKVLTSTGLRQELREKGIMQAGSFSWLTSSNRICNIFKNFT